MNLSPQHYEQFTPQERLGLTLAAHARRDEAEVARLWQSVPQMERVMPDPEYSRLMDRTLSTLNAVINHWVVVSHCLVRDRFAVMALDVAREYDALAARVEEANGNDTGELAGDDAALARNVGAKWKVWSAIWKGFEAAFTTFCADLGLTLGQLFEVLEAPGALVIEEARGYLHPDSRVSREYEHGMYRQLRQPWSGLKASG